MRLLDLFCGRWGWSRAFAKRGWECVGVDLVEPPDVPNGCTFIRADVLDLARGFIGFNYISLPFTPVGDMKFDFIVASPPCEQFSVFGMKMFHPNPPYPEMGLLLFNHTHALCRSIGLPYVIENVKIAQKFVGQADNHCGPFYLWGPGVPPLMPQGILKGRRLMSGGYKGQTGIQNDKKAGAIVATIPPELASCVCDYAERILEQREHEREHRTETRTLP